MRGLMAILALLAVPASADTAWPEFTGCMAQEQARFERSLAKLKAGAKPTDLLGISGVTYCGSVGIVACDRSGSPIPCQIRLAKAQDALRADVTALLPEPDGIEAALYPQLHAISRDQSAGWDCHGATAPMLAWCMAWDANEALRATILAWQSLRIAGLVPDAVQAGWATAPLPRRPKGRDD